VDVAVVALGDLEAGVDVRVSVGIRVFIPRQPAYNVAALPDGFFDQVCRARVARESLLRDETT
jgi:hypothetical protein